MVVLGRLSAGVGEGCCGVAEGEDDGEMDMDGAVGDGEEGEDMSGEGLAVVPGTAAFWASGEIRVDIGAGGVVCVILASAGKGRELGSWSVVEKVFMVSLKIPDPETGHDDSIATIPSVLYLWWGE